MCKLHLYKVTKKQNIEELYICSYIHHVIGINNKIAKVFIHNI